MQPLFATYALKWKDYLLALILMRYFGYFVPLLRHSAVGENLSRFSTNKNQASRNINTGKADPEKLFKEVKFEESPSFAGVANAIPIPLTKSKSLPTAVVKMLFIGYCVFFISNFVNFLLLWHIFTKLYGYCLPNPM